MIITFLFDKTTDGVELTRVNIAGQGYKASGAGNVESVLDRLATLGNGQQLEIDADFFEGEIDAGNWDLDGVEVKPSHNDEKILIDYARQLRQTALANGSLE